MRRQDLIRLLVLFILMAVITALHYLTNVQDGRFHDIYRRLYYIPIVLGGLWFSLRGGVATAVGVSVLFAPHVLFQWGHRPTDHPEQYLEILLYNFIGFLTGSLSQREHYQKLRYQKTAEQLEASYTELRNQADLILEIEEQLRRADRLSALGELSAGMAHEIRNPLGSIRGTAEILRDGMAADDPRREFTGILVREVERLNRVVEDFLRFARPAPVARAPVDVDRTLAEVLTLIRQTALKSRVRVEFDAGGLPTLSGNGEQLRQAFLNLALNALQAMNEGGELRVATMQVGGEARISFADNGQGIPPENLERIFNPFFTTRHEGTGLGLAITHRIVQGHGGRISVESRLGRGTTFTIALPMKGEQG